VLVLNNNIYLAGTISYFVEHNEIGKAINWRKKAISLLEGNFNCFNPMDGFNINNTYDNSGVIIQNKLYLEKCNIMLLNLDMLEDSPGTVYEMSTFWNLHKPIIAYGQSKWIQRAHIKSMITIHFESLEESCEYIKNMYGQNI